MCVCVCKYIYNTICFGNEFQSNFKIVSYISPIYVNLFVLFYTCQRFRGLLIISSDFFNIFHKI